MKKRILITGISSFIGYHLAHYFSLDDTLEVFGTHSKPLSDYTDIQATRLNALHGVSCVHVDLTDAHHFTDTLHTINPHYVIYHAGFAKNYHSFDYDLDKSFEINLWPLRTLYRALEGSHCEGILITGSAMEYSDSSTPNRESDVPLPSTPYGLSKLYQTQFAKTLSDYHQLSTRVIRVFIPFGAYDAPNKLLPSAIKHLKAGESIDLSPCTQKRDFIHVHDLYQIYKQALHDFPRTNFDIFNGCSGQAMELKQLLLQLCTTLGASPSLLRFSARPLRDNDTPFCVGSREDTAKKLNLPPQLSIEEGVQQLAES